MRDEPLNREQVAEQQRIARRVYVREKMEIAKRNIQYSTTPEIKQTWVSLLQEWEAEFNAL